MQRGKLQKTPHTPLLLEGMLVWIGQPNAWHSGGWEVELTVLSAWGLAECVCVFGDLGSNLTYRVKASVALCVFLCLHLCLHLSVFMCMCFSVCGMDLSACVLPTLLRTCLMRSVTPPVVFCHLRLLRGDAELVRQVPSHRPQAAA